MRLNTDIALVFVIIVAVVSAIFVGIMNGSGIEAAGPWAAGFALAYLLFRKPI